MKLMSSSREETVFLGKKFSSALRQKDMVILEGVLGGGKTTFVKGILEGWQFKKPVLSPTFTLLRQYRLKKFLVCHLDLYRLDGKDIFNLGLDDLFYNQRTIALIEWGDKIEKFLDKYIRVRFLFSGEKKRQLTFSTKGYSKAKIKLIAKTLK